MKVEDLSSMPESDDLAKQLEDFKQNLTNYATGGGYEDDEFSNDSYKRIRKLLIAESSIPELVPDFFKKCRNLGEFWSFIKQKEATYEGRRVYLSEIFNPIIDEFEKNSNLNSLEFSANYEEKEIIGQGGFGLVYKYIHKRLQIPFAVKIFAPAFYIGGEKEIERFFQEARMLFKLNHPNIIKIHDAGLLGKRPYIRMEYFKGLNLNQVLIKHGTLNLEKALTMIENIVLALKHAHEDAGLIHRDLKPSNIMVARPNKFRIIDFGLGVFIENELYSRITKTGEQIISGLYNAPELIKNPKLLDKRSDIYSIGAIWFTMLKGQPPAGTTISKQLQEIDGIKQDYEKCIGKCLADSESRYKNCQELLNDIEKIKDNNSRNS